MAVGLGQDAARCDAALSAHHPWSRRNTSEYPSGSTTTSSWTFPAASCDIGMPVLSREDGAVGSGWSKRAARDRLGTIARELPGGHMSMVAHPKELAEELLKIASE
jgi:hypothetical protein